jgi:anaerobic C4-dicarboxylate transporter
VQWFQHILTALLWIQYRPSPGAAVATYYTVGLTLGSSYVLDQYASSCGGVKINTYGSAMIGRFIYNLSQS